MNKLNKKSSAEHFEIHKRLLFLSMFLLSLVFAVKLGMNFADEELNSFLLVVAITIFILFVIVLVVTYYWKFKFIPRDERCHLLTTGDSYANQMMNKAYKKSWILTFVLLFFVNAIINESNSVLPSKFYIDLTIFLLLATFSVSFLVMFYLGDKEEQPGTEL